MDNQSLSNTAILDRLAKYNVGDKPNWVVLRSIGSRDIVLQKEDTWMYSDRVHPKVFYERKYANGAWKFREKIPRLPAQDFMAVMDLLTSDIFVERFEIAKRERSTDTGEFYYMNTSQEWIPESLLFNTTTQARKEKMRIKKLIKKWADRVYDDRV